MDKDHTTMLCWKSQLVSQTSLLQTDRFHGTSQLCHSTLLSGIEQNKSTDESMVVLQWQPRVKRQGGEIEKPGGG